jgi:hypothetical protein
MAEDKWVVMERENNRIPPGGYPGDKYAGHICSTCKAERVDSMYLHRHVCPDIPDHRRNYDMEYLERALKGWEV